MDEPLGSLPPEEPARDARPCFPWPARLVGAAMLMNVVYECGDAVLQKKPPHGVIVPLVLGIALLRGQPGALVWGRVVGWLSLIFGTLYYGASDPVTGVFVAALSISYLLLLGDPPRRWRVAVGGLLMLGTMSLAALGALLEFTGQNPFAIAEYAGKTDPLPADRVIHGVTAPFTYQLPAGGGWALLKPAVAREFNAEMEGFVVETHRNLFVGAIVETDVDPELTLKAYSEAVQRNLGGKLVDEAPLGTGVVLHTQEKLDDLDLERLTYLQIKGDTAVQVHAWGQDLGWSSNEPILRGILQSFKL